MAGKYDFTIEQGATFKRTVTWRDANDALVNLTGATAKMQIKDRGVLVKELTNVAGLTLGGALGTIQIAITAADTTLFDFDSADYDLEVTISGEVTRLLKGKVTLDKETTV